MSGTDVVRTKPSLFEKGHAKMGGRQKGSKNRFASSGWHARSPAAPRRRALRGQDMREQMNMNCYAVMTISDAILDDSSRQNIACKTFGAQVLSLLSMLDSVSSNPASICNPTRLHSTHLRSRSVRPS